jgi:hypothetical protein
MPIQCRNRKGKTYYLHQGKSKTGTLQYFFSMKAEGDLAEAIPEGYEIYENPNAQVFLRKIQPKLIKDSERAIVEKYLPKSSGSFLCDIKGKTITVFESDQDIKSLEESLRSIAFARKIDTAEFVRTATTFSAVFRFILNDAEKRLFVVERYCFKGSIDDWMYIAGPEKLESLAKNYLKHLGRESFYELY